MMVLNKTYCWLRYIFTRSISNETINLATYAKYTTEQQNNNNNYTHNNKKERKKEETNRKNTHIKKQRPIWFSSKHFTA